jgi:hypothetical protein
MTRKVGTVAFLITLATASAGAVAATSGDRASEATSSHERAAPLRYEEHDLFIETNATAGDAGLQMNLDGEDWRRTKILDPRGRKVMIDVKAEGRLRAFGLTELFFEASEPPFEEVPFSEFKQRFPEGKYRFRGRTVEGRKLVSSDSLSHLVPDAPKVTFPTEGAAVDPNGFTVTWEPVTTPAGVEIARYIVIVTQEGRDLSIELEGSATSAGIPGEFLKPGTETGLEVLSRERSGNQTITAISFKTS